MPTFVTETGRDGQRQTERKTKSTGDGEGEGDAAGTGEVGLGNGHSNAHGHKRIIYFSSSMLSFFLGTTRSASATKIKNRLQQ